MNTTTAVTDAENSWIDTLRDGTRVFIRPIHRQDVELERGFIEGMSSGSRRFRFLDSMKSPSEALLKQLTAIDASVDAAFVALIGTGPEEREIGVGRFNARADGGDCEFAVAVSDEWQHKGLGTLLMRHLIDVARLRGIKSMHSSDAADNDLMRRFAAHLNFSHARDPDDARQVVYSVDLGTVPASMANARTKAPLQIG
jgi:GNAT superfamily N-acetyltransferase